MRRFVVLIAVLLVAGCGSSDSGAPTAHRPRTVEVTVSVFGDRDPSGLEVRATGYRDIVVERFTVAVIDSDIGYSGDTCQEAEAGARRIADGLGSDIGTCELTEVATVEAVDHVTGTAGGDGTATLHLLEAVDYEVSAFVEIVEGDDGCHWTGSVSLDLDQSAAELRLDSNSCE